eukprot:g203.t1
MDYTNESERGGKLAKLEDKLRRKGSSGGRISRERSDPRINAGADRLSKLEKRKNARDSKTKYSSIDESYEKTPLVPRGKKELRQYSKLKKKVVIGAGFDFENSKSGKLEALAMRRSVDDSETKEGSQDMQKEERNEVVEKRLRRLSRSRDSETKTPSPTTHSPSVLSKQPLRMPRPPRNQMPSPPKTKSLSVDIDATGTDETEHLRLSKLRTSPFHRPIGAPSPSGRDPSRRFKLGLLEQSQHLVLPKDDEESEPPVAEPKRETMRKKSKRGKKNTKVRKTPPPSSQLDTSAEAKVRKRTEKATKTQENVSEVKMPAKKASVDSSVGGGMDIAKKKKTAVKADSSVSSTTAIDRKAIADVKKKKKQTLVKSRSEFNNTSVTQNQSDKDGRGKDLNSEDRRKKRRDEDVDDETFLKEAAERSRRRAEILASTRSLLQKRREERQKRVRSETEEAGAVASKVTQNDKDKSSSAPLPLMLSTENASKTDATTETIRRIRTGHAVRFPPPPTALSLTGAYDSRHRKRRQKRVRSAAELGDDGEDILSTDEDSDDGVATKSDVGKKNSLDGVEADADNDEDEQTELISGVKTSTNASRKNEGLLSRVARSISQSLGRAVDAVSSELAGMVVGVVGLRALPEQDDNADTRKLSDKHSIAHKLPDGRVVEDFEDDGDDGYIEEEDENRDLPQALTRIDVLKTGWIPGSSFVQHPSVCVHIVDIRTGEYLRKRHAHRGVVSAVECGTHMRVSDSGAIERNPLHCHIVRPNMTSPATRSRMPGSKYRAEWNEQLIYNMNIKQLLHSHALILFELLDYGPAIPEKFIRDGEGYHRVAWGFLRTLSSGGEPIIGSDRALKLSLYKYPNHGRVSRFVKLQARSRRMNGLGDPSLVPDVFLLYQQCRRKRYPSTLTVRVQPYVHVKKGKDDSNPFMYSEVPEGVHLPTQLEVCETRSEGASKDAENDRPVKSNLTSPTFEERLDIVRSKKRVRSRAHGESCSVPSDFHLRVYGGSLGNSTVVFSPDGDHIAIACVEQGHCPVRIHRVDDGAFVVELRGHTSLVHQLKWSSAADGMHRLHSASSDGTLKVWHLDQNLAAGSNESVHDFASSRRKDDRVIFAHRTLVHPSATYVYALALAPRSSPSSKFHACITGAYDRVLRLWSLIEGTMIGELRQPIHATHKSHINGVAFGSRGRKFFSADGIGIFLVWRVNGPHDAIKSYEILRQVRGAVSGVCIDSICPRPSTSRLDKRGMPMSTSAEIAVFAKGNILQSHELISPYHVSTKYAGATNSVTSTHRLACCYSPDGQFLLAGCEDGNVHVWNATTGAQISHPDAEVDCALFLNFCEPISGVAWSPTKHAIAMCVMSSSADSSFDTRHPVLLYAKHDL